MTRTINTTTFSATNGELTKDFTAIGIFTYGKAKAYAAKEIGCDRKTITLTTPLKITSAKYEIEDALVIKYGTKIEQTEGE